MGDGQILEWQEGFWFHSMKRVTELGVREIPESIPYHTCFSLGLRLFFLCFTIKQYMKPSTLHCTILGDLGG